MAEPDGWVRLHPLSAPLLAGKLIGFGFLLAFQVWADALVDLEPEMQRPGAGLVLRVGLAVSAAGLAVLAYASLAWRFRTYRIGLDQVELRSGIVFRSHRRLPLERIESVDTARPLVPRVLGLAEVRVEAISKKGNEVRLRYLANDEAERVRLEILARRQGAVPERPAPPGAASPIARVPARELVMGYVVLPGLAGAAMVSVAAIVSGLLQGWEGFLGFAVVGVVLAVSLIVPALVRVERLWSFGLADDGDSLVVDRGLLNLNSQRILTGRIQSLRIEQPLLWRAWGRHRVRVDVAGYRGASNEEAAAAAVLLPVAPDAIVRYLVARLEMSADLASLPYVPVPRRARWRSLRWRSFEVARTDTHLVVRAGVLWRRTSVVPHQRVQSARVTQGPWQRRARLATLYVDTAGARIRVAAAHRDAGDAVVLADDLIRRARLVG